MSDVRRRWLSVFSLQLPCDEPRAWTGYQERCTFTRHRVPHRAPIHNALLSLPQKPELRNSLRMQRRILLGLFAEINIYALSFSSWDSSRDGLHTYNEPHMQLRIS